VSSLSNRRCLDSIEAVRMHNAQQNWRLSPKGRDPMLKQRSVLCSLVAHDQNPGSKRPGRHKFESCLFAFPKQ